MKNLKRLVIHLNLDDEHFRQNSISAISELMISALDAITGGEVDIKALIATSSKKDISQFISTFSGSNQIEMLRKSDKCKYVGRNMLGVRKFDDWIHALEIGNIMHLNPLTTQELMWNGSFSAGNSSSGGNNSAQNALNRH